jgi:hypothetical protein
MHLSENMISYALIHSKPQHASSQPLHQYSREEGVSLSRLLHCRPHKPVEGGHCKQCAACGRCMQPCC